MPLSTLLPAPVSVTISVVAPFGFVVMIPAFDRSLYCGSSGFSLTLSTVPVVKWTVAGPCDFRI